MIYFREENISDNYFYLTDLILSATHKKKAHK